MTDSETHRPTYDALGLPIGDVESDPSAPVTQVQRFEHGRLVVQASALPSLELD